MSSKTEKNNRRKRRAGSGNPRALAVGDVCTYRIRPVTLILKGKPAEGIALLKAGIAFWEASGGKRDPDPGKRPLAEATALSGDIDNALDLIDEIYSAQIERPWGEERRNYADLKQGMPRSKAT